MNLGFHIAFGVLAVLFFVWQFISHRKGYQLLFAIWVASTFLIYVSADRTYRICLGIVQIAFCVVCLIALHRAKKSVAQKGSVPPQEE